jgi:hypothetical protein
MVLRNQGGRFLLRADTVEKGRLAEEAAAEESP